MADLECIPKESDEELARRMQYEEYESDPLDKFFQSGSSRLSDEELALKIQNHDLIIANGILKSGLLKEEFNNPSCSITNPSILMRQINPSCSSIIDLNRGQESNPFLGITSDYPLVNRVQESNPLLGITSYCSLVSNDEKYVIGSKDPSYFSQENLKKNLSSIILSPRQFAWTISEDPNANIVFGRNICLSSDGPEVEKSRWNCNDIKVIPYIGIDWRQFFSRPYALDQFILCHSKKFSKTVSHGEALGKDGLIPGQIYHLIDYDGKTTIIFDELEYFRNLIYSEDKDEYLFEFNGTFSWSGIKRPEFKYATRISGEHLAEIFSIWFETSIGILDDKRFLKISKERSKTTDLNTKMSDLNIA